MQPFRMAALFVAILISLPFSVARAADAAGTWLTQKGDARIHVARCGTAMCGTVVWIQDAIDPATGKPPVDDKNPDPAKRNRKIVGIRIFAMAPDGQGGWAGAIYNSDDGQSYAGKLVLRGPDELQVNGCTGAICGGELWHRVRK